MKFFTLSTRKLTYVLCVYFFTANLFSQTADFNVQHVQNDIDNSASTTSSITTVSSLNNAFALPNNNRKVSAGPPSSTGTFAGDDLSGSRVLTDVDELTYYRATGSSALDMRFNTSIWEYVGPPGGDNEMIIRGRYAVTLNGSTNSTTQVLSGIANANKCIPFITGIITNVTSQGSDAGTAIAYLENATTLRVQKGTNANNVTVYVTVVEFTGTNWTVLHGDSGNDGGDSGTITLRNNSDGSGTATNVSDWSEAVIFTHHRGDNTNNGTNDALADNWPLAVPGSNDQEVDWSFNANHDSNGTNRHFVHVLTNPNLNVTRYSNTSATQLESTFNISGALAAGTDEALIVGTSITSGGGQAYARGWRNYYFNSTTQAAHWCHRSGNTMSHEIQIVDLSDLTTTITGPEITISGNGTAINDGDTTPDLSDDTDFGNVDVVSGTNVNTFTINNIGTSALSVGAITISGAHASDFSVTSSPSGSVGAGLSTSFDITFNPSATGLRTASVSIVNGDSDENPYNFDIQGNGTTSSFSNVTVSVDWPSWSSENRVEVYDPSSGLITTIDNGYSGCCNNSYSTTVDLGCLQDLNNYYITMYDSYGDGWNGAANVTVTVAGVVVISDDGSGLTSAGVGVDVYFNVSGGSSEINVTGNGTNIADGDTTPDVADDTDFGTLNVSGGTQENTFTIENLGCYDLNLTGSGPTYVTISGTHAADFSITANPSTPIGSGTNTTFNITFDPSAAGLRTATVSISNDDSDENPYTFDIQGTGIIPAPEMDVTGLGISIADGDTTPSALDDTDFGNVDVAAGTNANTFTIENNGTLLLNVGAISITGAHASDFSVTANPSGTVNTGLSTTFEITFNPSATGLRTATISIANDDSDENPYNFNVQGNGTTTSFSSVSVSVDWPSWSGENRVEVYNPSGTLLATIDDGYDGGNRAYSTTLNLGCLQDLNNYYITMYDSFGDGWNGAASVTVTVNGIVVLTNDGSGLTSAGVGVNAFFNVTGGGGNEIEITGNGTTIADGDTTPDVADDTDFGNVDVGVGTDAHTFTINNAGCVNLNLTGASPYVSISGAHAADFSVTVIPSAIINSSSSTTFEITFAPSAAGIRTATLSIANDDTDENPYNFDIQGNGIPPLTEGPGGVTADLALWLKGTDGLSYTDGQPVSLWSDQGRGANATVNTAGQEPTYRDNATDNVNFNPVVEFDNAYTTAIIDYTYANTSTQFLEGTSGLYTQDMFLVFIPDDTPINSSFGFMDVFCGDEDPATNQTDATGIGLGQYSARFTNEVIAYAVGTTSGGLGYGVAEVSTTSSYDNVGIINARNNVAVTQQELYYNANNVETTQNDIPDFSNVNNSRFWLGRSEGWEASTNGRIAEVITYSTRKDDASLTDERNRIQSYLAIKYGITLGTNGTSQDYVDSDGTVIWDQSANAGFNYDIAGIGRDDASDLNQKQSRSVNNASDGLGRTEGILTFALTDIYATNNLNKTNNSTTFNDKEFLMWGNNGADLNLASSEVTINMSSGITPALTTNVSFTAMQRVWKVVENGGDIPVVKVRIPEAAIRDIDPPGSYYMFISDTGVFDPTADYRVMKEDGFGNLITEYDFDNTKYITFGYAPQVEVERSIYFDGAVDYIDMEDALDLNPSEFTISAWIKRDAADTGTKSIVSKRNTAFTQGYDFRILGNNALEIIWKNGSDQDLTSNTRLPDDEWHHVAAIYDGSNVKIYIDGIEDNDANRSAPVDTNESFYVGAAGKGSPTQHFRGNIDEVRVWERALTPAQLRFIMNQEIEANGLDVSGTIIPSTISKNEVASIPWSDLAGYYPMSVYTYTNTEDASGNENQGALRNLNTVDRQTAPLPYESTSSGDWDDSSTWSNGTLQTIPGTKSIVDESLSINWNIVRTSHDVTINDDADMPTANDGNRTLLGLYVDSNELEVAGTTDQATSTYTGYGLTVSHYLNLTGTIDLEGESQLMQTEDSDLVVASTGRLERDQQGTADTYTYNYWSSPVGETDEETNEFSYTLADVFQNVGFVTAGYDGTSAPVRIADYWVWKFADSPDGDYSAWQHTRSTGDIYAGEGFTMKGPGTGDLDEDQNYVFRGKPNNGHIGLTLSTNSNYLVGNPYPSAINAVEFINDNLGVTTGTLYFWEHWGGGNHILSDYQGGYAQLNLSGGTPSVTLGVPVPGVSNTGSARKEPGQYIPVGQGFFVDADTGGQIVFENDQRVFQKEDGSLDGSSVFIRSSGPGNTANTTSMTSADDRMKFRFGVYTVNQINRQLLLTIDPNATMGVDLGYDGRVNELQMDDMYWMIDSDKYIIQGSNEVNPETVYPVGIKTDENGINVISINALENVPDDIDIYFHDIENNYYHDLRASDYELYLDAGEYLDRFEITFSEEDETLSLNDNDINGIDIFYSNELKSLVLLNPNFKEVQLIEVFNIVGQSIHTIKEISEGDYSEYEVKNLSSGTYIVKMHTGSGSVVSKKVLVK